jgi:hypothetical protein
MIEVIDLESAEGTLWFSDEAELTVDKVEFEFEQASRLHGTYRKLTIFNDNYCYQAIKNRHERKYKYRVDLSYLDPHPIRERHIAWKWLYATLGLALLGALLVYSTWFANWMEPTFYLSIFLVINVSATLICLFLFARNTYDRIIFKSQYGRINLIELLNRYPDKNTFREFVGRFILQIKQAAKAKSYNQSAFLAQELVELRRLKDETVITVVQYEIAKTAILQHKGFQAAAA